MIAFGSSIGDPEAYRRFAQPGIERVQEPDSEVLAFSGVHPKGRSLNLILDAAAACENLEALVLVAPHVELADPALSRKVRDAFSDPGLAAAGIAGANRVRSIAWWEAEVTAARAVQVYYDHGGGELPAFSWVSAAPPPARVQALDGELLILSPWAVRHLRFDERLVLGTGVDLDFCLQAAAAGRHLQVLQFDARLHQALELVADLDLWIEAHVRLAEKWTDLLDPTDGEAAWRRRARRGEAEREAARAFSFSRSLELDARVLELERDLERKTTSLSWRATAPLRAANLVRRRLAGRETSAL